MPTTFGPGSAKSRPDSAFVRPTLVGNAYLDTTNSGPNSVQLASTSVDLSPSLPCVNRALPPTLDSARGHHRSAGTEFCPVVLGDILSNFGNIGRLGSNLARGWPTHGQRIGPNGADLSVFGSELLVPTGLTWALRSFHETEVVKRGAVGRGRQERHRLDVPPSTALLATHPLAKDVDAPNPASSVATEGRRDFDVRALHTKLEIVDQCSPKIG